MPSITLELVCIIGTFAIFTKKKKYIYIYYCFKQTIDFVKKVSEFLVKK